MSLPVWTNWRKKLSTKAEVAVWLEKHRWIQDKNTTTIWRKEFIEWDKMYTYEVDTDSLRFFTDLAAAEGVPESDLVDHIMKFCNEGKEKMVHNCGVCKSGEKKESLKGKDDNIYCNSHDITVNEGNSCARFEMDYIALCYNNHIADPDNMVDTVQPDAFADDGKPIPKTPVKESFTTDDKGKKYDDGKLRYDLIPPEALKAMATILTYGAMKYGDRNWEKGIDSSRLFAARQRHDWADHAGETFDDESGLPHLWHAFCNMAMQIALEERK